MIPGSEASPEVEYNFWNGVKFNHQCMHIPFACAMKLCFEIRGI